MENPDQQNYKEKKNKSKVLAIVLSCVLTFFVTAIFFSFIVFSVIIPSLFPKTQNAVVSEALSYINSLYLYDVDFEDLKYGSAKGMVEALNDPFTTYLTPDEFTEYMQDSQGNYIGIGVVFTLSEEGKITVAEVYPDSPGMKAGLLPGDILTHVDKQEAKTENYNESIELIKGTHIDIDEREGTEVLLTVLRNGEEKNISVTRGSVHIKSVNESIISDGIGYIKISSFDTATFEEFDTSYNSLLEKRMTSLIIDLRDNGGGSFSAAIQMAGGFLEEDSLVVYTTNKKGDKKEYKSNEQRYFIKPVILVNSNSASASEVFTGALRDHDMVTEIVGTKTYGKGITQSVIPLISGGGLILTTENYYTPSGDEIHKKGINPTCEVKIKEEFSSYPVSMYTDEIDTQKAFAINLLKN